MASRWNRNAEDVTTHKKTQNIAFILQSRELCNFAQHNRQFHFISQVYYNYFPETTPRSFVIKNKGNGKFETYDFKFHPMCKNGC